MSSEEEQIAQRRANLADIAKLGVEIYPRTFERRHTIAELVDSYGGRSHHELEGERIEKGTAGRILAVRSFGKAKFLVLSHGRAKMQVYIRPDSMAAPGFAVYKLLDFCGCG